MTSPSSTSRGSAEPWSVDDAPADYIDKMVGGIVGVELLVDSLVGKRKLSQNRPAEDVAGIVVGLDTTRGRVRPTLRTP